MASGPVYIIGYGPGVGDATAREFSDQGRPAALFARDADRVAAAAVSLKEATGHEARGFACDASDLASLVAALEQAHATLGPPAILVYNAARWRPGPVLAISDREIAEDLRICVGGAWAAARWAEPFMRAAGAGAMLFTGGGLALHPSAAAPTLSIGKAGLRALALMLADELAPAGIRAGTVTIAGEVKSPSLPAQRVAEAFVALAAGKPDSATCELVVRPA